MSHCINHPWQQILDLQDDQSHLAARHTRSYVTEHTHASVLNVNTHSHSLTLSHTHANTCADRPTSAISLHMQNTQHKHYLLWWEGNIVGKQQYVYYLVYWQKIVVCNILSFSETQPKQYNTVIMEITDRLVHRNCRYTDYYLTDKKAEINSTVMSESLPILGSKPKGPGAL